ncbi:MAG: PAS domain S-box protein [Methylococcus sp.]
MNPFAFRLLLIGLALVLMLAGGGIHFFRQQASHHQTRVIHALEAIAGLKARQIEAWRAERLSDAASMADSPLLAATVRRWREHPTPDRTEMLLGHLRGLRRHGHYHDIWLVDPAGQVLLAASGSPGPLPGPALETLRKALSERRPSLSGIHEGAVLPFPHIGLTVPLLGGGGNGPLLGGLHFIIDAHTFLTPLLAAWPGVGGRAETLLAWPEGDKLIYLSGQRQPARLRRLSLAQGAGPAADLILGGSGAHHGPGLDGAEVVAAVQPVSDTDWRLVAQLDAADVLAAPQEQARQTALALLAGVVLLGAVLAWLWRRHEQARERRQRETETTLNASEQRFQTLFEAMPDPAWIIRDHRFVEANPAALKAIGWEDKPGFLALHPAEISPKRQPDGEASFDKAERIFRSMRDTSVQRFDWTHKHRDGHLFPVEVTLSGFEWEGEPALYCVWRDMSERERVLESLRINEAYFHALFHDSNEAIMLVGRDGFIDCNPRTLELYGYDSKADFIRTHPADLSTPLQPDGQDSRQAADARMRAAFENGYQRFEWRHCRRDGAPFEAEVMLSVIDTGAGKVLQAIVRDISDRKRQEAEIRRYTEALDQVGAYIFIKDRLGRYVFANRPVLKLFGCSLAELRGRDDSAFFPAATVDQIQSADHRVIERGESTGQEISVRQTDGGFRFYWEDKVPLYDPELPGQVWGLCGISVDITERKRQEQQLRLSQFVLEKATDAVYWIHPDGAIFYVNDAACRMLGYGREELTRMKVSDLDPVPAPDRWRRHWEALTRDGTIRLETLHVTREGRQIQVEVSANYIRHEGQEYDCAIVRDISERKAAEQALQALNEQLEQHVADRTVALRASEERFRLAMEAANDGLWDYDFRTGQVYCNPAYLGMLGYAESDLPPDLDHRFTQLLHPDEREIVLKRVFDAFANSGRHETEFRLKTSDGRYRWILGRGRVVARDAEGRPLRAIGTHIDVTERRHTLEQLADLNRTLEQRVAERTAQAEAASAAKSQFLAHMSHEIRTPMNAVLGLAQLLEKEPLEPGQAAMVRHIREAGDALLHIINDILDFSKIEAGQITLEQRPFALPEVLRRLRNLMSVAAEAKQLRLSIPESVDCPAALLGDAIRLEQVLINLCANAIKFTQKGGVDVAVTPLAVKEGEARLRFEVRDSGIGMSAETLERLFRPFSQGDASISRRFGGTGLGLAISRRLVELMGGRIGASSRPGEGSTFWIELTFARTPDLVPVADVQAKPEWGEDTGGGGGRLAGLRVLVVDDNRMNRLVAGRALQLEGAVTEDASDGQEALDRLREQPGGVDVILMDIQMPVMDGLSATRHIRQDPALAGLPVIAVSAGVLAEEREAALAAGVNDFLTKPLDLARMVAVLSPYRSMD